MWNPATILISDPDPLTLSSLARQGRSMGLSVMTDICCEVVTLAERYRPSIIVLELKQKTDGRDLIAQLRRNPACRGAKIVVFSAVLDPFTKQSCMELGVSDYILKPARSQAVISRAAELAGIMPFQCAAVA
jgi:two-component system, OmpR family, response regulator AdeR